MFQDNLLCVLFLTYLINLNYAFLKDAFHQFSFSRPANLWALLVAGSKGFYNYRHQADICHAYHILSQHGVPDSNIIVMMYDDIANNDKNNLKGVIRNFPNGPNVYENVPKDYTGDWLEPFVFLDILKGDSWLKQQGKKVIESGPDDHILIYFVGHGAPHVLLFPNNPLFARDLNEVLRRLRHNLKFKSLLFIVESCFSGSMFEDYLKPNSSIMAITSTNSTSLSHACCFDEKLEIFLTDCFSMKWLADSDRINNFDTKTVEQMFTSVKDEINYSQVSWFGDKRVLHFPLGYFQGEEIYDNPDCPRPICTENIIFDEFYSELATRKLSTGDWSIGEIGQGRVYMSGVLQKVVHEMKRDGQTSLQIWSKKMKLNHHICYERLFKAFRKHCFDMFIHTRANVYLFLLINFCEINLGNQKYLINGDARLTTFFLIQRLIDACLRYLLKLRLNPIV